MEKADELLAALKAAGIRAKVDAQTRARDSSLLSRRCVVSRFVWNVDRRISRTVRQFSAEEIPVRNTQVSFEELADKVKKLLDTIQNDMLERARAHRDAHTYVAKNYEEFGEIINNKPGFIKAMWCGDRACEDKIKEDVQATSRCMPFEQEQLSDVCVCCGKPAKKMVYWGRAY